MEKRYYSNVLIPSQLDWRDEAMGLVGQTIAGFSLIKTTRSGHWLIQISSPEKQNLRTILDRAIEKY